MGTLEALEFELSKVEISPTSNPHAPWCWQRPHGSLNVSSHQEVARPASPSHCGDVRGSLPDSQGSFHYLVRTRPLALCRVSGGHVGRSNKALLPLPSFWTRRLSAEVGWEPKTSHTPISNREFPSQVSKSGEPGGLPSPAVRRQHHSFSCLSDVKASQPKQKV